AAVLDRVWLGAQVAPGPALFIDAEDDEAVIHKRLVDIFRYHEARFAACKGKLHLVSLAGRDAVLGGYSRKRSRIVPTALYEQVTEAVRDLKPRVIGIASSADVFAGNEIDRVQVQQFITLLNGLAATVNAGVVLIGHPSLTGINSGSGLSGSTQ